MAIHGEPGSGWPCPNASIACSGLPRLSLRSFLVMIDLQSAQNQTSYHRRKKVDEIGCRVTL
ncbi:MAG: hypothetical protein ACJZ64_09180 [Opitutales bacterium]